MHLAGSPGSNFAYLKDCFKEWSKNVNCHWQNKNIETETKYMITKFIMNHAFRTKHSAATTKVKASVSTLIQERGFQFGSKFSKT